jgi:alpha-tubulin suppressor-like RCC1 family protein
MNKITISALAFLFIAGLPLTHAQLSISPANLGHFTTTIGKASTAHALTINATGPFGALVVTAPAGFEVSTNATTGFAPSITLGKPRGEIQSVYRGSFVAHTGSVWDNGSGGEFPNESAFAAVTSNGSVVTWGSIESGGNASVRNGWYPNPSEEDVSYKLKNIIAVYSNSNAFVALKEDGSVVSWGSVYSGGNSSSVADRLSSNVTAVYSTRTAFAALKSDGSVVAWGGFGGASSSVAASLSSNVTAICSNGGAFAALKKDGSVVAWGDFYSGGNLDMVYDGTRVTSMASSLSSNVTALYSNGNAFAALKKDGSVVTWGSGYTGGNSSSVAGSLSSNVTAVYSNSRAFVALKKDGSVVAWGDANAGGNFSSVAGSLSSNVTTIFSSCSSDYGYGESLGAFAALKKDGSVVTWGSAYSGGNSSSVASSLSSNVTAVYSNASAFAALKKNGSVVTWGDASHGGNSSSAAASLSSNVTTIFSNAYAFAALKKDGSVITWGNVLYGGNSTVAIFNPPKYKYDEVSVAGTLSSGVIKVYSTKQAFAALKSDGSIVSWGMVDSGGSGTLANIGASISGLPSQIYVRLASSAQASFPSGELVFSSLTSAADENVTEVGRRSLSGTIQSAGNYTSSPNPSEGLSSNTVGPAQVQRPKKGKKATAKKGKKVPAKKPAVKKVKKR